MPDAWYTIVIERSRYKPINKTMKEIILIAGISLIFIGIFTMVYGAINLAISNQEKYECLKWAYESKIYDGYYLTEWQKSQCNHYGIEIK